MLEAQSLQLRGELANPGRPTLEDYLTQWLDAVQASLEPAAWTNYRNCLHLYVIPRLGKVQLGLLTPLTLSSLYAELLRSGGRKNRPLSPTTVRLVHGVLRKALNDAVQWGLLGTNPALRASVPKRRRVQLRVWSPEEAASFVRAVSDDRLAACWLLALIAGLRRGELAGLRWEDIDLDRATLRVAVQRTTESDYNIVSKNRRRARDAASHWPSRWSPCSGGTACTRRRNGSSRDRSGTTAGWSSSTSSGRGYDPQRVTDLFHEAVAAAGLPRIRLHYLRHTSATLALVAGIHPKIVQERLGHASIGRTLDIHNHVLAGMQHDAVAQVERLLSSPRAPSTPAGASPDA